MFKSIVLNRDLEHLFDTQAIVFKEVSLSGQNGRLESELCGYPLKNEKNS